MMSAGELKKGSTIELDGQLYRILDFSHIKMGRGSAQIRLKLRDVRAGHTIERTFQASEKFTRARLEHRNVQFLYHDGDLYYFMDNETFDQTPLSADLLGDALNYLKEGLNLEMLTYRGEPVGVELPVAVELQVTDTGPGFKGDTAASGTKPATLETGLVVQVPFFINNGDVVKVDTRSGEYLERA
ncbi:MAG: elongation factor P [Chloroflexi bacterium]|nr:MAG: elongation factor P [Chloroflexota bacterium]RLC94796.1 MAG: elongation factor P [Chloroflexota bacterium]